jgi:hypothetical protein
MPDDPMTLPQLMAALDAKLIIPDARHAWPLCPGCGRRAARSNAGHVSLCYPCTCVEVGASAYDLAVCWAHRITLKRWRTYESEDQLPSVTRRVWRDRTGK